jgi:3-oxoacyl-[acyl-carrier-protein] synthase II
MPLKPSDVVVTGIGLVSSIGIGADAFWESLRDGKSGIRSLEDRDDGGPKPPANWRQSAMAGHWIGGPILGFDAAQFVRPRKALKVMGRELQTSFAASQIAMDQAGLPQALESEQIHRDQVATIFGSQMLYGPASELLDAVLNSVDSTNHCDITKFGAAAMRDVMPLWMLKYLPNMAACHVGISIGATGPNNTIVAGDVSATSAMMESVGAIQRGVATTVICGGVGSRIDETYLVYRGDSPIATIQDQISRSSRPHAIDANGVVPGEAAATLIVETRASATMRNVRPIAVVSGFASRFMKPPANQRGSAGAIKLAISGALASAQLSTDDIGLIISHGIGDPQRDAAEREALSQCLPGIPVCMPVATAGHSGAATGALHMVAAVLSLLHQTIPATPPHGDIHPALANRFCSQSRRLEKPVVMVLTHNSHGTANAIVMRGAG